MAFLLELLEFLLEILQFTWALRTTGWWSATQSTIMAVVMFQFNGSIFVQI